MVLKEVSNAHLYHSELRCQLNFDRPPCLDLVSNPPGLPAMGRSNPYIKQWGSQNLDLPYFKAQDLRVSKICDF
jgi:hypothetical protein